MRSRDDFRQTANAMMADASKLHDLGSHRNACYLAGYAVECVLKAMIEVTGRQRPMTIHDLVSLREKAAELSIRAGLEVAKYGDPLQFAPTLTEELAPPLEAGWDGRLRHFCHWDPNHRYDGSRWTPEKSLAYLGEAEKALEILTQMLLDGVLG